uniref:Uncharacterized protein n=1 Tax=Myoviridae sp. ctCuC1 TaxID=2825055 RepID=A0A8S5U006_9CAUD|nr:MAG TPA: hypothetical protein [Myoviridae sp. ctCuC1]
MPCHHSFPPRKRSGSKYLKIQISKILAFTGLGGLRI